MKNFNKNKIKTFIFGELATTYFDLGSQKGSTDFFLQDNPVCLVDTHEFESKKEVNNLTRLVLGTGGTGKKPEVGYELAEAQAKKILAEAEGFDQIIIFYTVGGGTSGSAVKTAEILREAGKLVILFAFDLMGDETTDLESKIVANQSWNLEAMQNHNFHLIQGLTGELAPIANQIKAKIALIKELVAFRAIDTNDYPQLWSGAGEFNITSEVYDDGITTATKVKSSITNFVGNDKVKGFAFCEFNKTGNNKLITMSNRMLEDKLATAVFSKVGKKIADLEEGKTKILTFISK